MYKHHTVKRETRNSKEVFSPSFQWTEVMLDVGALLEALAPEIRTRGWFDDNFLLRKQGWPRSVEGPLDMPERMWQNAGT